MKTILALILVLLTHSAHADHGTQDVKIALDSFYVDADSRVDETSTQSVVFKSLCEERVSDITDRFKSSVQSAKLNFETQFQLQGGVTVIRWMDGSGFRGMTCEVELVSFTAHASFVSYVGVKRSGGAANQLCEQEVSALSANTLVKNVVERSGGLFQKQSCQVVATQIDFL